MHNLPLTTIQQDLWLVEQLYPKTSLLNLGGYIEIQGALDVSLLQQSFEKLPEVFDAHRLNFKEEQGEIYQYFSDTVDFKMPYYDFSNKQNPYEEAINWVKEKIAAPYDIFKDRLFDFILIKVRPDFHICMGKYHNLIMDGWSLVVVMQFVRDYYNSMIQGSENKYSSEPVLSYSDFIKKDQEYQKSTRYQKDKIFWQNISQKETNNLFKHNFGVPALESLVGSKYIKTISEGIKKRLDQKAKELGVSSFHVVLSILWLTFYKTFDVSSFGIGIATLNRSASKFKNSVGAFANTVPFIRSLVDEGLSVNSFILDTKSILSEMYRHQKFPGIKINKNKDNRIYDLFFSYESFDYGVGFGEADFSMYINNSLYGRKFILENIPIAIYFRDYKGRQNVAIDFCYQRRFFKEATIKQIADNFLFILDQIIKDSIFITGLRAKHLLQPVSEFSLADAEVTEIHGSMPNCSDLEENIKSAWQDILQQKVHNRSDFFNLGGTSLDAIKLSIKLKEKGIGVAVDDLYKNKVFEEFVSYVAGIEQKQEFLPLSETTQNNIIDKKKEQIHDISAFKKDLLLLAKAEREFLACFDKNNVSQYKAKQFQSLIDNAYQKIYSVYKLEYEADFDLENFNEVLVNLLNDQSVLRSKLIEIRGEYYLEEYSPLEITDVPFLDFSDKNQAYLDMFIDNILPEYVAKDINYPFVYRILLVRCWDKKYRLYFLYQYNRHDVVSDFIIKEYLQDYSNRILKLGRSYKDYLELISLGPVGVIEEDIIKNNNLADFKKYTELLNQKLVSDFSQKLSFTFKVSSEVISRQWEAGLRCFTGVIKALTGLEKIPFWLAYHGRKYKDIEFNNVIGEFADLIPLVLNTDEIFDNQVQYVEEVMNFSIRHNIHYWHNLTDNDLKKHFQQVDRAVGANQIMDGFSDIDKELHPAIIFDYHYARDVSEEMITSIDNEYEKKMNSKVIQFLFKIVVNYINIELYYPSKVDKGYVGNVLYRILSDF